MSDTFITLFQGNPAVIGTEEGGCDRSPHKTTADHMAWWVTQMQQHLDGGPQAGVYPMVQTSDGFVVHWGCIDVDEGEEASLIHASNIVTVLRKFGVTGWIERSRSKGYHVWVFAQDWVPAQLMRHALLAAAQIAQAPTREINPKQSTLQTVRSATTSDCRTQATTLGPTRSAAWSSTTRWTSSSQPHTPRL